MEVPNITSLYQTIIESKAELAALAEDLWRHPELAWHEEYAVKRLSDFLRVHGFRVETGYLGFPTSFRAECGSGSEAAFAIAAEYDALPEIGHGCGHNLIAMAAMAAALAVKRGLDGGISGRVVILGTPAEESGGGKVKMLQKGCLDDIGAAMMVHPSWRTVPDKGSTAIRRYDVDFTGVEAHAATTPEEGVNALDAVMLLFAGVNAFRQQMPDNCRIHGIVSNGGSMPNIIPGSARCRFYLRSSDEAWIERLDRRFLDIVAGAELMTGAKAKITPFSVPYRSRRPNAVLNAVYVDGMNTLKSPVVVNSSVGHGSSDFGNFSHLVPGIHPYFAISDHLIAGHSPAFAEAAHSELGRENALKAAAAMAEIALRYVSDADFRRQVHAGFEVD